MNFWRTVVIVLFLIFNLALAVIAGGLLYVSAEYFITIHGYEDLLSDTPLNVAYIVAPLIVLIIVAFILLLMALTGCLGSLFNFPCLLVVYNVMLVVVLLLQVLAAVLIGVFQKSIEDSFQSGLQTNLKNYNNHTQELKDIINSLQEKLQCCGVDGSDDWTAEGIDIPLSCCNDGLENCDVTDSEQLYNKGCFSKIAYKVKTSGSIAISAAVLFGFFQITGIIMSYMLLCCCTNKKSKKYHELEQNKPHY